MNPYPQERPCTAEDQAPQDRLLVDGIDNKPILLDFEAGRLSSDAGLLLLGHVDGHLGLTHALASVLPDRRDPIILLPVFTTSIKTPWLLISLIALRTGRFPRFST